MLVLSLCLFLHKYTQNCFLSSKRYKLQTLWRDMVFQIQMFVKIIHVVWQERTCDFNLDLFWIRWFTLSGWRRTKEDIILEVLNLLWKNFCCKSFHISYLLFSGDQHWFQFVVSSFLSNFVQGFEIQMLTFSHPW